MKKLKKTLALMFGVCMTFFAAGMVSFAASGELRFSDPSTTVGANVEITARLTADYPMNSVNATLTYDSQYLRFVSGSGVTDNGGQLQLTGNAGGNSEVSWSIQFQALAEGTTKINISSVSATDVDGDSVSVTQGSSTITIGPGDPSLISQEPATTSAAGGGSIEIDGQTYTVTTEIPDILLPEGFAKADMTYNGQTYAAAKQENGEMYAVYLKNGEEEEDFFLYDPKKEQFSKFEQIMISDSRYIILLNEDKTKELPTNLQKTSMTVNGKEFPAWQNMDNSSYYVVYALNSDGEKAYYQYDTVDETYQRYVPEKKEQKEKDNTKGVVDKMRQNLDKVIMIAWGIFLFMVIIMIVMAIKLRHRNLELDDLYEEYGIDDEEEVVETRAEKKARKKAEKAKKKAKKEDDFYDFEDEEDEYDEYEDDIYADDEEDDYEDSGYAEAGYEESLEEDFNLDEDSDIEDLDELLNVRVKKRTKKSPMETVGATAPVRLGHAEPDDTFKMDLIDLD